MKKAFTGFDKSFSLAGKVALITGGAAGIGDAIATLYAEKGARLALVDRSESVHATAARLAGQGHEAVGFIADVTARPEVERVVGEIAGWFDDCIDILVNNAGIVALDPAEDVTDGDWDRTMAVNLKAVYLMSQVVGRRMIARGEGGKIVNLASQAGVVALDRHLAYCASKAGVISMTKVLALEWGKHGINVNSISPTVVLTELGKRAWAGEVGEAMKTKIPIGRFAQPEEIAACALFLASGAADMIHGENLVIDGGYTIQ